MTTSIEPAPKVQFCSVISENSGESPFGSAWFTKRYILAELPLPWKYNIMESPNVPEGMQEIIERLHAEEIYPAIIAIAPDEEWSVDGHTRIIEFVLPSSQFSGYEQREYLIPTDRVTELMEPFLRNEHGESLEPFRQGGDPNRRDYLVCTHGAIDACCAKFGYPIYKMLKLMADNPEHNMRVWRCTHFGGHRFAPTMVEMPAGRYWGHLDARDLGPIVRRELPRELIRKRYRGWAALPYGAAQIAECEIFSQAGWDWTNALVTPSEAPPYDWDKPAEQPQTMTFAFTHAAREIDGSVKVTVTPNGFVSTTGASGTQVEMHEAQQFAATLVASDTGDFFG